jgi:hypothetical protein
MLKSNREMLSRVLKVDLSIHSRDPSCWRWTAQVLDAFQGLWHRDSFVQAVRQGTSISIQEFTEAQIADGVERC